MDPAWRSEMDETTKYLKGIVKKWDELNDTLNKEDVVDMSSDWAKGIIAEMNKCENEFIGALVLRPIKDLGIRQVDQIAAILNAAALYHLTGTFPHNVGDELWDYTFELMDAFRSGS
jgi:hypothetical protein